MRILVWGFLLAPQGSYIVVTKQFVLGIIRLHS